MKKVISMFLAILMAFSLVACGPKENTNDSSQIEVSEGLLEVSITLPAEFVTMSDMTEEAYLAYLESDLRITNATFNEDGSVTFTVTKAAHREMMTEMMLAIDESIAEAVADETNSFSEITHNADLTEFNFIVNKAQYEEGFDGLYVWAFGLSSSFYQTFNGTADATITMNIIDEATNEIFETATFPDNYNT